MNVDDTIKDLKYHIQQQLGSTLEPQYYDCIFVHDIVLDDRKFLGNIISQYDFTTETLHLTSALQINNIICWPNRILLDIVHLN